jgi:hypothetical protein
MEVIAFPHALDDGRQSAASSGKRPIEVLSFSSGCTTENDSVDVEAQDHLSQLSSLGQENEENDDMEKLSSDQDSIASDDVEVFGREETEPLSNFTKLSLFVFVGAILLWFCWMSGYLSSSFPTTGSFLMKLFGWMFLIFIALFPSSSGDEEIMFPPRKFQMLVVYLLAWNVLVDLRWENLHPWR